MHQVTVRLLPSQQPSPRRVAPSTLAMSLAWEGFSQRKSRMAAIIDSLSRWRTACAVMRVQASSICMDVQLFAAEP
ncbi:hypothetical protein D9M68_946350 [compost metagenome]